jgi:hypothetical protein
MKKICIIFSILFFSGLIKAQEEAIEVKKPLFVFSGYIIYEAYYDSYKSVTAREGNFYLFPLPEELDNNGNDINKQGQLNMLSAQSRFRAKINGPEAFGAKVNGLVEIDFLGTTLTSIQTPRIRHMFVNLTWERAQLLLGQSWHPLFVTECFPQVLGMGAAIPFNPLNRAPQVKYSYNVNDEIEVSGAAISYIDQNSTGPANAQKNAILPDIHATVKYKTGDFITGIVSGFKTFKPRLVTETGDITNQKTGSFDVAAFAKYKAGELTLKAYTIYGQNLTPYSMIGGYGAANEVDDYSYSNINTMAFWGEGMYDIHAFGLGMFVGYTANLSSSASNYYELTGYTRGGDIDNLLRISPRITYTSGKVEFGFEYMMTRATYMTLDAANGKYEAITTADAVSNNRLYFSAKYSF